MRHNGKTRRRRDAHGRTPQAHTPFIPLPVHLLPIHLLPIHLLTYPSLTHPSLPSSLLSHPIPLPHHHSYPSHPSPHLIIPHLSYRPLPTLIPYRSIPKLLPNHHSLPIPYFSPITYPSTLLALLPPVSSPFSIDPSYLTPYPSFTHPPLSQSATTAECDGAAYNLSNFVSSGGDSP